MVVVSLVVLGGSVVTYSIYTWARRWRDSYSTGSHGRRRRGWSFSTCSLGTYSHVSTALEGRNSRRLCARGRSDRGESTSSILQAREVKEDLPLSPNILAHLYQSYARSGLAHRTVRSFLPWQRRKLFCNLHVSHSPMFKIIVKMCGVNIGGVCNRCCNW